MKKLIKQISLIERIDQLVRMHATGRPKQLSERLNISEATLFRIIDAMKELNAPLHYDFAVGSYVYEEETQFKCGFYTTPLSNRDALQVNGGNNFNKFMQLAKIA